MKDSTIADVRRLARRCATEAADQAAEPDQIPLSPLPGDWEAYYDALGPARDVSLQDAQLERAFANAYRRRAQRLRGAL